MKRLLKITLFAVLCIVIAAFALVLVLQTYLTQPDMIEKIRLTCSRAVGGEVQFSELRVKLLRGIEASDVTISAAPDEESPFLTIDAIELRYLPWKLLFKELDFKIVRFHRPHLIFRENQDGDWDLAEGGPAMEPLTFDSGPVTFDVVLRQLEISDGTVSVSTRTRDQLLHAQGIQVKGQLKRIPAGITASGQLEVASLFFYESLRFRSVSSRMDYRNDRLVIESMEGSAYDGTLLGNGRIEFGVDAPTFLYDIQLDGLHLPPFLVDLGAPPDIVTGTLDLDCQIQGTLEQPDRLQGTGTFTVSDASLRDSTLVAGIAQTLGLEALRTLDYPEMRAEFKLADRQCTLYRLEGRAHNLRFTGGGTVDTDRRINLDVLLQLSPELSQTLTDPVRSSFPTDTEGNTPISFKVTGTLKDPETNIDRIIQEKSALPESPAP